VSGNGTGPHLLSKAEIIAATDLPVETVDVPEWGGSVRVRGMDVNRRLAWTEYLWAVSDDGTVKGKPGRSIAAAYAVLCIVDEDGEPMFSLAEVDALGRKSPAALERVASVARRLSGLGSETAEVDATNLKAQTSASPSGSRSPSA
jgi:hypothetical protein